MNKRGSYFFVLDVFIASAILVLTLVIIFSSRANAPPPESSYLLAQDFLDFLTNTELRDTGGNYKNMLVNDSQDWYVKDTTMTLLQTIAFVHHEEPVEFPVDTNLKNYIGSLSQGIVPEQYGIIYMIKDESGNHTLFTRPESNYEESLDSASLVMTARRITFFKDGKTLVGPKLTEVSVWT